MKMLKDGQPIEIPEGTWARLKPEQKAQYTKADGSEASGPVEIQTIQTTPQKKTIEEVVHPVATKDDITGNPEPIINKEAIAELEKNKQEAKKPIRKPVRKAKK